MNGDRNQKATALTIAFYVLGLLLFIWGAIVPQEGRIKGTISKRLIDIPVYLQDEPEYKDKIQNAKVTQGWGGGRLILWLIASGVIGVGIALTAERLRELEEERPMYVIELLHKQEKRKLEASYDLSIDTAIKQREGTARLAIVEDQLLEQLDEIRAENGWFLPEPKNEPTPAPPVLKSDTLKSPAEYAVDAAKIKEGILSGIDSVDSSAVDAKNADKVSENQKVLFQDRGLKIARSLAALKMSILSAAPTGAGKTCSLYRWLGDLNSIYPDNECYVISHKRDSFLGLLEAGKVTIFDDLNPEASLGYLDKAYAEMKRRLNMPESERKQFEKLPVRLILDDWFASYGVLKNYSQLWAIVKTKIGAIITKGREANVCLYIATQSFNLEAIGIQDSNIRGNLAITCQGLVTEKLDEFGELVEQGNYESLQLLINNSFIVSSKLDRDRLNAELDELVALSRLHQLPAIFSAVGKPTLALTPYYEKPIAGDDSKSTNVAVIDRNDSDIPLATKDQKALRERLEGLLHDSPKDSPKDSPITPITPQDTTPNNGTASVSGFGESCDEVIDTGSDTGSDESVGNSNWETNAWYKWLPTKAEVVKLLEETDATFYSLAYIVRTKLKKTDAEYNRKAKSAIVQLMLDLERVDLIEKYQINPKDYPTNSTL